MVQSSVSWPCTTPALLRDDRSRHAKCRCARQCWLTEVKQTNASTLITAVVDSEQSYGTLIGVDE